ERGGVMRELSFISAFAACVALCGAAGCSRPPAIVNELQPLLQDDPPCLELPATAVATPAVGVAAPPQGPATLDISVTNNDSAGCAPRSFDFFTLGIVSGFTVDPWYALLDQVAPGATLHVTVTISASFLTAPGTYPISFFVGTLPDDSGTVVSVG